MKTDLISRLFNAHATRSRWKAGWIFAPLCQQVAAQRRPQSRLRKDGLANFGSARFPPSNEKGSRGPRTSPTLCAHFTESQLRTAAMYRLAKPNSFCQQIFWAWHPCTQARVGILWYIPATQPKLLVTVRLRSCSAPCPTISPRQPKTCPSLATARHRIRARPGMASNESRFAARRALAGPPCSPSRQPFGPAAPHTSRCARCCAGAAARLAAQLPQGGRQPRCVGHPQAPQRG